MKPTISPLAPALRIFAFLTVITGITYPLLVTGVAQVFFKDKANGSLLYSGDKPVGSELIGQEFKESKFFHSRPSAIAYAPMPSGGSNAGPTNADFAKAVSDRMKEGGTHDLLFASGSGLDPHISPEAALNQVPRIAHENGLSDAEVAHLVSEQIEGRTLGFLGESRVNVLKLNLALRAISHAQLPE